VIVVIAVVLLLGYFGFIPGLSNLFGSNKPKDLGIKYTEVDHQAAREKSQIEYATLPVNTSPENDRQTVGTRVVSTQWSSAEVTSLMNNRPWRYYPYANVQIKFNGDGSAEISGIFLKDRLAGYGARIGAPKEALEFVQKFLPANPVFYVKGRASLENNQVAIFEPQAFEIGRVPLPVNWFLSIAPKSLIKETYAIDAGGILSELGKVKNKRSLIIGFINQRLSLRNGFFANKAYFAQDKLVFDGNLPEKELTAQ